jgi:hypothetical protein
VDVYAAKVKKSDKPAQGEPAAEKPAPAHTAA